MIPTEDIRRMKKLSGSHINGFKRKIRRTKKLSGSHFNDTNGRYNIRKSDVEVISMIRTEYDIQKSRIYRSHFYDTNFKTCQVLVFKLPFLLITKFMKLPSFILQTKEQN